MTARLLSLMVRRFGEDNPTPVVIDDRRACGTFSDHLDRGCIGLQVCGNGWHDLIHLTSDEALRLADLLRAMAKTNESRRR